jgi:hypothetical protein
MEKKRFYSLESAYNSIYGDLQEANDHEHSMIRTELKVAMDAINRLQKKMGGEGDVEAWVQSKITKAADYLQAAANYIDSGESDVAKESFNGNMEKVSTYNDPTPGNQGLKKLKKIINRVNGNGDANVN